MARDDQRAFARELSGKIGLRALAVAVRAQREIVEVDGEGLFGFHADFDLDEDQIGDVHAEPFMDAVQIGDGRGVEIDHVVRVVPE